MAYTLKFQEILDKVTLMSEGGTPINEIQDFFFNSVKNLGSYERLNNLYRIRPKRPTPGERSRFQFFSMNKMQRDFHKNRSGRDLILKMRQGGVTTYSCIVALDVALWSFGSNVAIMAHNRESVKQFFRISKNAFDWFNKDWGELFPVSSKIDNVNELKITETGSSLVVCTETKGLTLDYLHISEACFVDDSRISESLESVPSSGRIIMESTPDAADGMFYEMWDLWHNGEYCAFQGHFYPWWYQYPESPDIDGLNARIGKDFKYTPKEARLVEEYELTTAHIIWRRLKISEAGGDESEFQRKYPEDAMNCFLSGSNNVFPMGVLSALLKNKRLPAYVGELVLA